jgi:hypothetical protein
MEKSPDSCIRCDNSACHCLNRNTTILLTFFQVILIITFDYDMNCGYFNHSIWLLYMQRCFSSGMQKFGAAGLAFLLPGEYGSQF